MGGGARMVRGSDLRSTTTARGEKHQALMRMRSLRMYTSEQDTIEAAIKHQMILVQVRHANEDVGSAAWDDPTLFHEIFCGVLAQHGTCEQDLGFRAFIYMRADEWIDRSRVITSPVLPLIDAVRQHEQLVASRQHSWEKLKATWRPFLLQTQSARNRKLTP